MNLRRTRTFAPLPMNLLPRRNLRTPHPALSPLRGEGEELDNERLIGSMRDSGFRMSLTRRPRCWAERETTVAQWFSRGGKQEFGRRGAR
jgi:hypothetical protein